MSGTVDFNKGNGTAVASLALERLTRSPAALVENLPIGIYTCDREGLLVQYNRRAVELWGSAPTLGDSSTRFGAVFTTLDRDGRPVALEDMPMAQVLKTGNPVRDRELTVEKDNGERLSLLANVDPLFDEQGNLVGGVNCFQDITEIKTMRRQMSEGRRVGRRVMEALPVALYTTDANGKLLYFNQAAERFWGYKPELGTAFWCGSWKIYTSDGEALPHDRCPMAIALKEKRALIGPEAIAERPDGTRVPFLPHPTPIFDSTGQMVGAVNMLIDLSDQKQASARQHGLINELNHRVKNTLATIQSLAAQTMRDSKNPSDRDFEARLMALSRVHDQLTRHTWEWADFTLIASETFASCRDSAKNKVQLHGPSVKLNARTALSLAMVLHELARNAEKYGALSTPTGKVTLTWDVEDNRLLIDWTEEGGPTVTLPRRRGFGARLLERSIAHELGGRPKLDFAPAGVHCTMEIPLPE